MKSNGLEVKASGEVDGSDNVLKSRHDARGHLTILGIGSSRGSSNTIRVFSDLLSVVLSGGCSHVQVRALRVGERARGDELGDEVRMARQMSETSQELTV